MLKKHMAACLVATAFAAAPAFAQTQPSGSTDRPTATGSGSTSTGSSAMQPSTSSPSTGSSSMSQSSMNQGGAAQGQFMTQLQANHLMASDLIGTRVVSANNESIGDINDVIVDRNGQTVAAVVGVGGFLGIGEKNVAIPFNSLEFATAQQANAMDNRNNTNAPATTGSTTSGTSSTTANTGTSSTASSSNANEPERVVLRMTKAELQAAPTFNKDGNNTTTGSATAPASNTTNTAPKQ
jgi:sporulation protein YlmC with PRC-barrel domain